MKELGLRLNAKKSVLSPLQRTTFLGVVWDSVSMQARLSPPRVDSILAAEKSVKLGQLLTVKQFQRLLGLMAAASNGIPFGLLHMRPLQWWLRTRGFSPRGNPFRTIKVTRRCLRALVMWKKPWFLSQGPVLGAPCRRKLLTTDASLTGWGAILRVAHLKGKLLSLRAAYLPGVQNIGADTLSRQGPRPGEWKLHPEVVELIWRDFGLPHASSSSGTGCYAPRCRAEYGFPILCPSSTGILWSFLSGGAFCPKQGAQYFPPARTVEPVGLASEGAQLIESGLSTEVAETILQSRAPSTRKLYALKWRVFTSLCSDRRLDPVNCPIGTVLEFLQDRFTAGLTPSTLKVYVAAIGAYHIPLGGMSVGKDPLVSRFPRGTWRSSSLSKSDQEANNLLCPVRALDAYVHRAALWRKSDQLFVRFGPPNKGGPVSKQRMSKWVVEAISLAYEAAGQPSPLAVRSHSTRSMAASKALISGVSLQDVCDAAGWSSPHTFVSENLVKSLFPMLMTAVEKNKRCLAVKFLGKARAWITDIITDVDKIVERYDLHNRDVASATSDVIQEKIDTDKKIAEQDQELKRIEKALNDMKSKLQKTTAELHETEKKINSKHQELQEFVRSITQTSDDLSIVAAVVPFIGLLVKSIYEAVHDPEQDAHVRALEAQLNTLIADKTALNQKHCQVELQMMDLQMKAARASFDRSSIPDPIHLSEVQKSLTKIQDILIQLKIFWVSVRVLLDSLEQKTFAGEDIIKYLVDLKDVFLDSIKTATEAWGCFAGGCKRASAIFQLQTKDAYKFLEVSPSSLSKEQWQIEYESVKKQLEKIDPPQSVSSSATPAISE
ncbi:unnamed protein product [Leuciscus chuanchicus]